MNAIDIGILRFRKAIDQATLKLRGYTDISTLRFRNPIDNGILNTQLLPTFFTGPTADRTDVTADDTTYTVDSL